MSRLSSTTLIKDFNPRSYKRSDGKTDHEGFRPTDFNPRSYKRSDIGCMYEKGIGTISIHAPTRGATFLVDLFLTNIIISIHAPTRGATRSSMRDCRRSEISIHAPPRGATAKMHNNPYTTIIISCNTKNMVVPGANHPLFHVRL